MQHDQKPDPEPGPADCPAIDSYPRLVERLVAPGEDPRQFKELYDRLYTEWQPHGITEWFTFKMILKSHWAFSRLDRMEAFLFARIGRAVWEQDADLTIREVLGPAVRETRGSLNRIARMRSMREKSLATAQRHLKKYQAERKRRRPEPQSGPKLADLAPGSNLIQ